MKPEQQIEMAERFAQMPGTEKWPFKLLESTNNEVKIVGNNAPALFCRHVGPWLPGTGYWQPAEFLRRTGCRRFYWQLQRGTGELQIVVSVHLNGTKLYSGNPESSAADDCMYAIYMLAKLAKEKGGVFMEAWMKGCEVEE